MSKEVEGNTTAFTDQDCHNATTTIAGITEATTMVPSTDIPDDPPLPVQQIYSFWAPLMQYNNNNDSMHSSLLLHYPTFSTTALDPTITSTTVPGERPPHQQQQRTTAWQSLDTTNRNLLNHPPIVELV